MKVTKRIAQYWIRLMGLEIKRAGPFPDKCVIAVVPHTSNWDFPTGVAVRHLLDEKVHFVAKDALFRWPFGAIFRKLGGLPVDRSQRNNFVQAIADMFNNRRTFRLALAPEGTRSKVTSLKSGFYFIAKKAGVPIILCAFDWGKGEVRFNKPFYPTDDQKADFDYFYEYFENATGYRPENSFSRPETAS